VDGALASDGSFAIYQLSQIFSGDRDEEERQLNSLWRVDLTGGAAQRLTDINQNATGLQLTADALAVLYLASGETPASSCRLVRLPLDGGRT